MVPQELKKQQPPASFIKYGIHMKLNKWGLFATLTLSIHLLVLPT